MRQLLRPGTVICIASLLGLIAAVLLFWPSIPATSATPKLVPQGDQEIAWLSPATSASTWERFVAAIRLLQKSSPDLGLEVLDDTTPFPDQTTAISELAICVGGRPGVLRFRWYKLTGDADVADWIHAFMERRPPPLAVIGGNSSDRAWELARDLQSAREAGGVPPLLLLTTATADRVGPGIPLMSIYAHRTFRFCFTDRQMADAITDFIWTQPDLQPDSPPIFLVHWNDDAYSTDLCDQFHEILGPEGYGRRWQQRKQLQTLTQAVCWWAGVSAGVITVGLHGDSQHVETPSGTRPFWQLELPYSIGAFEHPNSWEEEAADRLINEMEQYPDLQRPLLVLAAAPQPARRFLRALFRTAPADAERFVLATGDAIDFNTVYRDRKLMWPIQDIPVPLVIFCHRNPADPRTFQPSENEIPSDPLTPSATGSQDLLLYEDVARTLIQATYAGDALVGNPDALRQRFEALTREGAGAWFDEDGNPRGGTGEFIVCLRPERRAGRVLPRAILQVWNRARTEGGSRHWRPVLVAGRRDFVVDYVSHFADRNAGRDEP